MCQSMLMRVRPVLLRGSCSEVQLWNLALLVPAVCQDSLMTRYAGLATKYTWSSICMRMEGRYWGHNVIFHCPASTLTPCLSRMCTQAWMADRWSYDPLNSAAEFTYATQCQIAAILILATILLSLCISVIRLLAACHAIKIPGPMSLESLSSVTSREAFCVFATIGGGSS